MVYNTQAITIATEGNLATSIPHIITAESPISATIDGNGPYYDYEMEIVKRNTRTLVIVVTDDTGVVQDITGFTMKLTVKKNSQDEDSEAVIGPVSATITDPVGGEGNIALTAIHTNIPEGEYIYDIKIQNADESSRHTVVGPSKFTVIDNVTQG